LIRSVLCFTLGPQPSLRSRRRTSANQLWPKRSRGQTVRKSLGSGWSEIPNLDALQMGLSRWLGRLEGGAWHTSSLVLSKEAKDPVDRGVYYSVTRSRCDAWPLESRQYRKSSCIRDSRIGVRRSQRRVVQWILAIKRHSSTGNFWHRRRQPHRHFAE